MMVAKKGGGDDKKRIVARGEGEGFREQPIRQKVERALYRRPALASAQYVLPLFEIFSFCFKRDRSSGRSRSAVIDPAKKPYMSANVQHGQLDGEA